jgi:hypothetical protein
MGSINMFHTQWMGLKALTIVIIGKQHPRDLVIGWGRETSSLSPKHSFSGSSVMNMSSNHHMGAWMVCGALTIIKDMKTSVLVYY